MDCTVTASDSTATCTEAGRTTYTATCTFLDQEYTDKQIVDVPATGHRYGEPGFTWTRSEESGYTCTATFTCSACEDTKIEPCTVTPGETVEPTCGADGKHVYVAKVTFEGTEYTGTKDEAIPATGDHQYGDDGFCTVCNTEQRLATPVLSSGLPTVSTASRSPGRQCPAQRTTVCSARPPAAVGSGSATPPLPA